MAAIAALALLAWPAGATTSPYVVTSVAAVANAAPAPAPNEDGSATVVISQKNRVFLPGAVTIRVHRRITIKNDDDTLHHAYCASKDFKYSTGPQEVGSVHQITFHNTGTFEVRCAIHPAMLVVVTVTE